MMCGDEIKKTGAVVVGKIGQLHCGLGTAIRHTVRSRSRRAGRPEKSRDLQRVEEELSDLLTAAVEVRVKRRTKRAGKSDEAGELAIQFGSLDELNGLIERLRQSFGP